MSRNREDKLSNPNSDRRGFLSYLGWALAGIASAGMARMTWRFLAGKPASPVLEPTAFGPPEDYPTGMVTKKGRVVLFRDKEGFWAVTVVCPHLGCQPAFHQDENIFVCPCHGSRFDSEGRLLAGPATHNLPLAGLRLDSQRTLTAYPEEKVLPGYRFCS
jgi:cytochrome b6-f complex iron-sulfur subunit